MAKPVFGKGIDPQVGKATQFPHNDPTKGGRPKTRPLKEMLEAIEGDDFTIRVPIKNCVIYEDVVVIEMPSKEFIAQNLLRKATKDVRWFQEWAKIMGEYAAKEVKITESYGGFISQFKEDVE